MKISKKMKELVDRANELCFSNEGDRFFVTLAVCPLSGIGGFQVWFDKWMLKHTDTHHLGTFLDLEEDRTLAKALLALEDALSDYELNKPIPSVPQTIIHSGHNYKLVD